MIEWESIQDISDSIWLWDVDIRDKKIQCDSWLRLTSIACNCVTTSNHPMSVERRDKFFFIVRPVISIATGELYSIFVRVHDFFLPSSPWIDKGLLHTNNNCSISVFIRDFRMQIYKKFNSIWTNSYWCFKIPHEVDNLLFIQFMKWLFKSSLCFFLLCHSKWNSFTDKRERKHSQNAEKRWGKTEYEKVKYYSHHIAGGLDWSSCLKLFRFNAFSSNWKKKLQRASNNGAEEVRLSSLNACKLRVWAWTAKWIHWTKSCGNEAESNAGI